MDRRTLRSGSCNGSGKNLASSSLTARSRAPAPMPADAGSKEDASGHGGGGLEHETRAGCEQIWSGARGTGAGLTEGKRVLSRAL